jgi:hypothetical protein
MSVVAAASTIKHASRRAATLTSNPPMSSPASLIVNNQLGSKAYRLDHSLQTHFSEPVMRQNSLRFLAPAGTASRSACSRWPMRGRLWE